MSGRGRGRTVTGFGRAAVARGTSINDRFSQIRGKSTNQVGTRVVRRVTSVARGESRFNKLQQRTTGRRVGAPLRGVTKTRRTPTTSLQARRGRVVGGVAATQRLRGKRGASTAGRRGGAAASRGGRLGKKKGKTSVEGLDADLDKYMGRSEKVQSAKLDEDLEAYMTKRAEVSGEEKSA